MVFVITIEESEGEVVENEPARDFSKDLGEKATIQDAYDQLYITQQIYAKTFRLAIKKLNEIELEKERLIVKSG